MENSVEVASVEASMAVDSMEASADASTAWQLL